MLKQENNTVATVGPWTEWSRHVLAELKRNNQDHDKLLKAVSQLQQEVTKLRTKAAMWGSLGGMIFAAAMSLLLQYLKG